MIQNIHLNSVRAIDSKLYFAHYYDFMLHKGEVINQSIDDLNSLAIADFSSLHIINGKLYSDIYWDEAVNNGVLLKDIGLTGVDNGLIVYDKNTITKEEFLNLYTNSEYTIESGDTRLFMTPVTGNTKQYKYPLYAVANDDGKVEYIVCKGGFYQGFFKLEGFDYQVLPNNINNDMLFHFDIKPRSDYEVDEKTVNYDHKDNKGIFFFLGTRAENKFWPLYKTNSATTINLKKENIEQPQEPCSNLYIKDIEPNYKDNYFENANEYFLNGDISIPYEINNNIQILPKDELGSNYLYTYDFQPNAQCGCEKENTNVNITEECECKCYKYTSDDYFKEDINITYKDIVDSEGYNITEQNHYEIETDNKFLMFDRTENGFTTKTWTEGTTVKLIGHKNLPNINYFLLMNRTPTGYTVHTINQYNEENGNDYNIYKDIRNNVFALRITDEGAIGYRYGALDCSDDNENKYEVIEEYSKDGLVKTDEWNSINIRFSVIDPAIDKCDNKPRKMRIMFYVNGCLVFISKELDTLNFKALNEEYQRQEAVPYNISLGGGSIGLLETILPDYYKIPEYILPIEKDFCGTFLGDIKSFKIYKGNIYYQTIKNYLS